MLAALSLDLAQLLPMLKYSVGILLLVFSALQLAGPRLRKLTPVNLAPVPAPSAPPMYKRKEVDRSSDTPPPTGFAEHCRLIQEAAPNANPDVWWKYALAALTEAEVALAEAKLAQHPALNATPVKGEFHE